MVMEYSVQLFSRQVPRTVHRGGSANVESKFWTCLVEVFSLVHSSEVGSHPSLVQCDIRPF